MIFTYETTVHPDWIDHNDHMRDAYYGLVFSLAGVAMQEAVGFDAAYRARTGCTIYLVEDHKHFLREVRRGASLRVETRVLACDTKRFHLHLEMVADAGLAAVSEMMELHVRQHPGPAATEIPSEILQRLRDACLPDAARDQLRFRARAISLGDGRPAR